MLSKNARRVLKITKSTKEKSISYLDLKNQLLWDFDTVKSAGNQLVQNDFAEEKYHRSLPGQQVLWGIVLTEKGRNSRKYLFAQICGFLLKSIIVPISVSIIAAIITTVITAKIMLGT